VSYSNLGTRTRWIEALNNDGDVLANIIAHHDRAVESSIPFEFAQ